MLVRPAAQALRSGGARPEAKSAQSLGSWSPIELLTSPTIFRRFFSLGITFSDPTFLLLLGCLPLSARARTPLLRAPALRESDSEAGPAPGARGRNCGAELPHTAALSRPL